MWNHLGLHVSEVSNENFWRMLKKASKESTYVHHTKAASLDQDIVGDYGDAVHSFLMSETRRALRSLERELNVVIRQRIGWPQYYDNEESLGWMYYWLVFSLPGRKLCKTVKMSIKLRTSCHSLRGWSYHWSHSGILLVKDSAREQYTLSNTLP